MTGVRRLFKSEIEDRYIRENFNQLETQLDAQPILKGNFQFREDTLSAPSYPATVRFYHNMPIIPQDIIVTSQKGGTITWDMDSATAEYIDASITAETTFRMFIGTYGEGRVL